MYIDFNFINQNIIDIFKNKFNLINQELTILYKKTEQLEKKYDDFEKSICPYIFINNIYYIRCNNDIYKITSKVETSTKISNEDIIASIKLKISLSDILKMYQNTNYMFIVYKDEIPQSQIKIISINDTSKEKSLQYAYINGLVFDKS